MSAVKQPQSELPRHLRGGADVWDQPQASVVLDDDNFASGPLISVMTFDPMDKAAGATLSSGNLAVSASADSASAIGYRTLARPENYIFYSLTVTSSAPFFMGITAPRNRPSTLTINSGTTFSAAFGTSEWVGMRLVGLSVGDVVDLAYNRAASRLYHRINGGAWNSSGDPVAGTGGSLLGTFAAQTVVPLVSLASGAAVTANFGSTAFTYPMPSGYTSWETPPAGGVTVTPAVGSITVAGLSPTVVAAKSATVSPAVGAVTVTGFAPTVVAAKSANVAPAVGAVSVSGLAPTVTAGSGATVAPPAGAVSVAGFAPTVSAAATVAVPKGDVSVAGLAPSVSAGASVGPSVGGVTVAGFAPTVVAGSAVNVSPAVGAVAVAGLAPMVAANANVSPQLGTVQAAGLAPSVAAGVAVFPALGQVSAQGYPPVVDAGSGLQEGKPKYMTGMMVAGRLKAM